MKFDSISDEHTQAFKGELATFIDTAKSITMYEVWHLYDHLTHNQGVAGSSPAGPTYALRSLGVEGLFLLNTFLYCQAFFGLR